MNIKATMLVIAFSCKNIYISKKKKNIRHYNVPIIYIPWYAIIMEGDDNCYDIKHGLKTKTEKKTCFQCQCPETFRTVLCRRLTVLGNDDARAAPCFCVGL